MRDLESERLGHWNIEKLGHWQTLGDWGWVVGTLGHCDNGALERWGIRAWGGWDIESFDHWHFATMRGWENARLRHWDSGGL